MVELNASLVLDLGAGDQALAEACREIDLIAFCEAVGENHCSSGRWDLTWRISSIF